MEIIFLTLYILLPLFVLWRTRSIAWTVVTLAASLSIVGIGINLAIEWGFFWSRLSLQIALLAAFAAVAVSAFLVGAVRRAPVRRQVVAIVIPTLLLVGLFLIVWVALVPGGGFTTPVGFLMGHPGAEDNAKWLDFTAGYASGGLIEQLIPTGGPLQLVFTFVGTAMGVLSAITLGGYNEVFVAANTVVVTEYFLAVLAPLAVAPLVNARFKVRREGKAIGIPSPFIWLAGLTLASANLLAINYGHVTFQYVTAALVLVSVTFLVSESRSSMWMALIIAGSLATIWWPLNILSFAALLALLVGIVWIFVGTRARLNFSWALAFIGVLFAMVGTWQPLTSSLRYLLESAGQAAVSGLALIGGVGGGLSASAAVPTQSVSLLSSLGLSGFSLQSLSLPNLGIGDSSLFAASGGTEQVGPVLGILAALALVGSGALIARDRSLRSVVIPEPLENRAWVRYLPLIGVVGYAVAINALDQWSTGQGPNYGAMKMAYLAAIVVLVSTLALAMHFINSNSLFGFSGKMSIAGWTAVGAVVFLLIIDSLVPRSIALLRPQQWSPSFAYVANQSSNWYPAEVNETAEQSIASNPVACVFLPQGAPAPTALVEPPDSQRPYACTRILAGLSGMDSEAQSLVDWLRREWTTNTPAWTDEYDRINSMPESVKSKTVILMDSTANVIGLETVQGLLNRYTVERVIAARENG